MTWAQLIDSHFWTLLFFGLVFGGSAITAIVQAIKKIMEPVLRNRLDIQKEMTKQAELEYKQTQLEMEMRQKPSPKVEPYKEYQQGYTMEQEQ